MHPRGYSVFIVKLFFTCVGEAPLRIHEQFDSTIPQHARMLFFAATSNLAIPDCGHQARARFRIGP